MHTSIAKARLLCPDYPSTPHWPLAVPEGATSLLATEKLDGANAAIFLDGGEVRVRNRTHVLRKGYLKATPAKQQFLPLFAVAHAHKKALLRLEKQFAQPVAVYGEWLWAVHGVLYPRLTVPFLAFALWLGHTREFVDPYLARAILNELNFDMVPEVGRGEFCSDWLLSRPTAIGDELSEGVVLTWGDGVRTLGRAKSVRAGYVQNYRWSDVAMVRQERK
jgi:hypothetical protein